MSTKLANNGNHVKKKRIKKGKVSPFGTASYDDDDDDERSHKSHSSRHSHHTNNDGDTKIAIELKERNKLLKVTSISSRKSNVIHCPSCYKTDYVCKYGYLKKQKLWAYTCGYQDISKMKKGNGGGGGFCGNAWINEIIPVHNRCGSAFKIERRNAVLGYWCKRCKFFTSVTDDIKKIDIIERLKNPVVSKREEIEKLNKK